MADGSLWEGLQQPIPVQKGLWDGLYDPATGMPYPGNAPDYGDLSQRMTNFEQRLPGHIASGIRDWIAVPGQAYGTVPGGPPTPEQEMDWGRGTALGQLGMARMPGMAGTGAVGAGGARLVQPDQGIFAYHSSPYTFDRFDLSRIGTGEGAQRYGHGIYAAENPAVSGQGGQYWNQFLNRFSGPELDIAKRLRDANFDRKAVVGNMDEELAWLEYNAKNANSPEAAAKNTKLFNETQDALRRVESGDPVGPRTYEVNINARPEQMLNWDAPLAMDSPARAKLLELGEKGMAHHGYGIDRQFAKDSILAAQNEALTGEGAMRVMGKAVDQARPILKAEGDPRALFGDLSAMSSQQMLDAGIPGIRYLDQGSRLGPASNKSILQNQLKATQSLHDATPTAYTTKEIARLQDLIARTPDPTHNYVIFDPNKIDIRKMYAVPGAVGAGAAATGSMWDSLFPQREEQ